MPPLVPVVKIFKKNWGHRKNLRESGGQIFKGSDRESANFSTLATSNIRLLLFFGEEDQQTKLVRLVRKKFMVAEEKLSLQFYERNI